ncbi:MAG TPA: DUF6249 domain-containing protein [Candidatus Sulfotelmatobacter sp.]|nr:DUF6249 domain-containing protein [Candidatus Sulfotelmatobacter sp.]
MWLGNIFDADFIVPLMIFSVPIVAIIGGITMGIVRTLARQRMVELAQQERIAAIQRGVDPGKLPPIPAGSDDWDDPSAMFRSFDDISRRRSQGLMIGGIVTLFTGIGLSAMLIVMHTGDNAWAIGLVPGLIGLALILSGLLVRPRGDGQRPNAPTR